MLKNFILKEVGARINLLLDLGDLLEYFTIEINNLHKFKLSWTQNNSKTNPTCHSDNATLTLLNSTGKNLNTISPSPSLPAAPPSIPDTVSIGHGHTH